MSRRCPAREKLEFHHDEPYGVGGDRSANNTRLLCECHNGYMAELDYGKDKMARYRRSADSVREPQPTLQLVLDRVASRSLARAGRVYSSPRGTSAHIEPRRSPTSKPVASSSG